MRRQIIILIAALLLCASGFAQTYPGDLAGDKFEVLEEALPVQVYLYQFYDMSPWSMPNPVGAFWYIGELTTPRTEALQIRYTQIAQRACKEDTCVIWNPRPLRGNRTWTLPWNEDCGCYLHLNESTGEFTSFTLSLELQQGLLKQGFLNFVDGEWVYNGRRSIYTYFFEPLTSEIKTPQMIRAQGRIR